MRIIGFFIGILYCCTISAQRLRWEFAGERGISWQVKKNDFHIDHIEMSGMKLSAIISYGTDSGSHLVLRRKLVFPMLRIIPNNTRGSLIRNIDENIIDSIRVEGQYLQERPTSFYMNVCFRVTSPPNT